MFIEKKSLWRYQAFCQEGCSWTMVFCCTLTLFVSACRNNVRVKTTGKDVISTEDIVLARTYFQTRNPLTLKFDGSSLSGQGTKKLLVRNTSTDRLLIEDAPLTRLALGLTDQPFEGEGFTLAPHAEGFEVIVNIFPLDEHNLGAFLYGENQLNVQVKSDKAIQKSEPKLTLKDFPIADLSLTSLGEDIQEKDGFQGWVSPVGSLELAPAAEGGAVLTSGFGNIINH